MMVRSTSSNSRPDTLVQDRTPQPHCFLLQALSDYPPHASPGDRGNDVVVLVAMNMVCAPGAILWRTHAIVLDLAISFFHYHGALLTRQALSFPTP
jgi:hypothetical protein